MFAGGRGRSYTVTHEMPPRRFTLEEAESLLPRLTALLLEMRELKLQHDRFQEQLAELGARMRSNGHGIEDEAGEVRKGLEEKTAGVNRMIEQVQDLGCELKGIEEGLIDFRALKDGREVYLCWKLGEPNIEWWHGLDTGFAGRQPLRE